MYSWYDIFLELLLAAAVFAVILILSQRWENQRVCRVVDDRATPKVEEEPVAQDDTPPLTAKKSLKTPDKLSVFVKAMGSEKTLVIKSSPADKVMDVKLKIQELEGTPVDLQRLIFCGRPLKNKFVLDSCGVTDGSVLHFVSQKKSSVQVVIKQLTGSCFVVECDENDKVGDLMRKIEIIEGTAYDSIRLLFAGKQLLDCRDLRSYNIVDGSTVHMLLRLRGGFSVNIRMSDGRSLILGLFGTIGELKQKIKEKSGIPIHRQVLLFNGNVLEDEYRREDYNICGGSTIDVNILRGAKKSQKPPGKLSVIVKAMGSERTLVIKASPSDRVMDVKFKIQEIEGTPVNLQRLIFRGRPLHNQVILKSCEVVDGSVMHVVEKKKHSIHLTIVTLTGREFSLECDENDKVEDVKRKIEDEEGIEVDRIRLIHSGKQLEDERNLRHYNLEDGSIIHMVIRLRGGFIVYIRISDGRSLDLFYFDTVTELKLKIQQETGILVQNQELLFNGKVLQDGFRRIDYNIESGSTIDVIIRGG